MRYQAYRVNRVWLVFDETDKHNLSVWQTEEGAEAECNRLNLLAWQAEKPVLGEPLRWESSEDLEERLLAILDRMHGDAGLWDGRLAA